MKHKIRIATLALLFYVAHFTAFSQDSTGSAHGYFGVSFGATNTLGSYANDQSVNDGYTTGGYNLKFDFLVGGKSNVGLYGHLGFFQNGLKSSIADNDSIDYTFSSEKRTNLFFMVGPAYSLSAKAINIDFRTSFGFIRIADYSWTADYNPNKPYSRYVMYYYTDQYSESPSWKPGYSLGVNFRVDLGANMQAMFGIDYMGASYRQYSKSDLVYYDYIYGGYRTYKQEQGYSTVSMSTLQLSWGIAVKY